MGDFEYVKYEDDCQSDIDLGVGWLVYQIKQKPSGTRLSESISSDLPSYLYELVKHDYRCNSRIQRFINPAQSFSVEQSYINLAIVETAEQLQKEKRLCHSQSSNAVMDKFEEIYGTKTQIDIQDIFKTCKDNEKKVIVFGRAGIGKSTFCRYVVHQWASGAIWQEYDLIALIPLRSLTEQYYPPLPAGVNYGLVDVLRKACFSSNYPLSDTDVNLLQLQYRKSRILWLLDGYDEIVLPAPEYLKHLLEQLLRAPHHIVTSRPYLNTLSYGVRMEIIGFTDENIPKYIKQFFEQVECESDRSSADEQRLSNFLALNCSIWGIAHIPINLELICSVWSNTDWSETEAMTITMLYEKLSEWICRRYLEKQKRLSTEDINRMRKRDVYLHCKSELAFLESLAFRGMENRAIILSPKLLEEAEIESSCSLTYHPHLLNIGVLKSLTRQGTGTQIETDKDHYFVHLSFQEYFGARYLINTLQSCSRQKIIAFIQRHKYNRRLTLLFRFASGLAAESSCKVTIMTLWDTILGEPIDCIGIRHMQLVMACFDEVLYSTTFPYREELLTSIQKSIEYIITSKNLVLQDHLVDSMRTCALVINEQNTQKTFSRLLQNRDDTAKKNTLRFLDCMPHFQPTQCILRLITSQLDSYDPQLCELALTTLESLGRKAATREVVDRLIIAFSNEDESSRIYASQTLGSIGAKAATAVVLDQLMVALEDRNPCVRSSVCHALRRIGEKSATNAVIDCLVIALADENQYVRTSASQALARIPAREAATSIIDRLVLAFKQGNQCVRSSVCHTFKIIGKRAMTSVVIDCLLIGLRDGSDAVRYDVCEAFGRIAENVATSTMIDHLVVALTDVNHRVRSSACKALGRIGEKAATISVIDRLLAVLEDEDQSVRSYACQALTRIAEKTTAETEIIDRLVIALENKSQRKICGACEALGRIGEKVATRAVIDRLLILLEDENHNVKSSACSALYSIGEKAGTTAVLDRLIITLKDESQYVKSRARKALVRFAEQAVTTAVTDRLVIALEDDNQWVRSSIYDILANIGEKAATSVVLDHLVSELGNEDPILRVCICQTIARIGEKAATSAVIDRLTIALDDENQSVRSSACQAIARIGEKAATSVVIDRLIIALDDSNQSVRSSACDAFTRFGDKAATSAVIERLLTLLEDEDPLLKGKTCETLCSMGEKAATRVVIDRLAVALGDKNHFVSSSVCLTLGRIGEKAATNAVLDGLILALGDEKHWVRSSAYETLRKIGEKAATSAVIDRLMIALSNENESGISGACEALSSMGEKAATSDTIYRLFMGLQHSRDWTRHCYLKTIETLMKHNECTREKSTSIIEETIEFSAGDSSLITGGCETFEALSGWAQGEGKVWGQIGCLAGLAEGIAITCCSNKIVIYDGDEPKCVDLIDVDMIEEVIHIFNGQDGNALRSFFTVAFKWSWSETLLTYSKFIVKCVDLIDWWTDKLYRAHHVRCTYVEDIVQIWCYCLDLVWVSNVGAAHDSETFATKVALEILVSSL